MMRRLRQIFLALLALLMAVIVGGIVYAAYMGGIERLANDRIRALFAEKNNLDIHIGEIGGDIFTGFSLRDVDIFYVDSLSRYRLASVPSLQVSYSFSNLWHRRYILDFLYLDSIDITLQYDTATGWQLPPLTRSSAPQIEPGSLPSFSIGDLRINRGHLTLIRNGDTTHVRDVDFAGAVEGDQGTYGAELNRLAFDSDLPGVFLDAAEGKVTYSDHRLLFEDVALSSGPARLQAEGNLGFGDRAGGSIQFDGDNIDITEWSRHLDLKLKGLVDVLGTVTFVDKSIEGSISLAGDLAIFNFDNLLIDFRYNNRLLHLDSVYGSVLNGCSLDGKAEIDFAAKPNRYLLEADVRNFNLNHLVKDKFESDLTGHLILSGESFSSKTMVLNADVDLFESTFDDFPIQQASGSMTITTDSLIFADSFRVDYFENVFYASGTIDYNESIDLAINIELNNLDRYRQTRFFIEEPGGRGYAEATLTGKTSDPDLRGWFASDSAWIYGLYTDSLYATVDIARFLTGRQGSVDLWFDTGAAWSLPFDTGFASLTIDSNLVYADSVFLHNHYATITCASVLDYLAQPQQLRISELDVELLGRSFSNPTELLIEVDSSGFIFNRAEIGDANARLWLKGRVNYDESMDFRLAVEHLPIASWLSLFDTTLDINGYLSADASVAGNIREPEFGVTGSIDSLTYRGLKLGTAVAAADYGARLLEIDSVRIYSDSGWYGAQGEMYIDLALTTDSVNRFPDRPMSIKMHATDSRFDLVTLILPSVEELTGNFWADFELTGHPQSPHLDGEAYVKNARLKYFDIEHPIYADSAGISMHDDSIVINSIEAYATDNMMRDGRRSYAYIEGAINLLSIDSLFYDLEVRLENEFPFAYELDEIHGKVEGRLFVEGPTPPTVSGDIKIISVQYRVPFAEPGTGSPILRTLLSGQTWNLNINIEILSNYWIKNEDIDAEFAGEITLIREHGNYRFIGEMEILRGRGFLFDKTFRLEPGSRVTFQGSDTLNPQLDITGYTRVSAVRATTDQGPATEQVDLCIHIGGTLEKPDILPCGGSDIAQSDILPLIVANYYGGDGLAVGGQIEDRLFGLGFAQFSQIGGRRLNQIGVETFEIDPVYGENLDPWNAWVTIGKYVGEGLYVYGRSTIAGQTRQEVGFEYRWFKSLLIEGRRDEDALYHLNLRLHWEFE